MLQNIAFKDTYKHKAKSKRKSFLLKSLCLATFCSFAQATQNPSQNLANSTNNPNSENAAWQQTQQAQDSTSQNLLDTLSDATLQDTMTKQSANENNENNETQQKQDSPNATDTTDKNPNQNPQQESKNKEEQKLPPESTPKSTTAKRGFIGLEASYAGLKYDEKGTLGSVAGSSIAPRAESSGGGLKIGILGGYRHFFTQGIGVRGYANIDYFESKSPANLSVGTIQAIHYGINADFLMDFKQIGVFFGLGVGGVHYFGSGVNRLKEEAKSSSSGFGVSQNGVETGLQIGLQSAVCKSVGIELVAKIPFISHYFINKGSEANIISRQITHSYTVGARILYHF